MLTKDGIAFTNREEMGFRGQKRIHRPMTLGAAAEGKTLFLWISNPPKTGQFGPKRGCECRTFFAHNIHSISCAKVVLN
jgi:hypothetical protein